MCHRLSSFSDSNETSPQVLQFPLDVAVSPRPKALRCLNKAGINRLPAMVFRPNPKRRYSTGVFWFLLLSLPHRIPSYDDTVARGRLSANQRVPLY